MKRRMTEQEQSMASGEFKLDDSNLFPSSLTMSARRLGKDHNNLAVSSFRDILEDIQNK